MNIIRITTLSALAAAALGACSTLPPANALLDEARSSYRSASADSQTQRLAPSELKQAGDALAAAESAFARKDDKAQIDHLAYLARQRVALAQETAARKGSEVAVTQASGDRDRLRLDARTREADRATQSAAVATSNAAASQRQADAAQRQSAASMQAAAASQQVAAASQQQAGDAERRNQALEAQMRELNAQKTQRGMVITMGDVLFDTGQAALKPGGAQGIQRLGGFLKERPQRRAMIEGYTDSTGSDGMNMTLSGRRADAVMTALLAQGVDRGQLTARGYGEAHPVADNGSSSGRQQNRRVEIVLSDEQGVLTAR